MTKNTQDEARAKSREDPDRDLNHSNLIDTKKSLEALLVKLTSNARAEAVSHRELLQARVKAALDIGFIHNSRLDLFGPDYSKLFLDSLNSTEASRCRKEVERTCLQFLSGKSKDTGTTFVFDEDSLPEWLTHSENTPK
jgi:hypothetical protein